MSFFIEQMVKILEYMWILGVFGSVDLMRFFRELGENCGGY